MLNNGLRIPSAKHWLWKPHRRNKLNISIKRQRLSDTALFNHYSLGLSTHTLKTMIQIRRWHPTPVLLPGKSHGCRSLVGCSTWIAKSWTRLSDFTFTFHFPALEKKMATHSSILAWRIPGTGEPGGLPSMGSHRVGHDWSDLAAAAATNAKSIKPHYLKQSFQAHWPKTRLNWSPVLLVLWDN